MPDFFEVALTQRAARSFRPDDIDDATVARILTAATHAPSAENSQPFVFVVVRDAGLREAIGALTVRIWEGGAKALEAERLSPAFMRDVDRGAGAHRGLRRHPADLRRSHGRFDFPGGAEPAVGRARARSGFDPHHPADARRQ